MIVRKKITQSEIKFLMLSKNLLSTKKTILGPEKNPDATKKPLEFKTKPFLVRKKITQSEKKLLSPEKNS